MRELNHKDDERIRRVAKALEPLKVVSDDTTPMAMTEMDDISIRDIAAMKDIEVMQKPIVEENFMPYYIDSHEQLQRQKELKPLQKLLRITTASQFAH